MADYFAVLSRTLAGFDEPKTELRAKLYERARMTIRRQLDSHSPTLDDTAIAQRMEQLEDDIRKVEAGFGPPNVDLPEPSPAPSAAQDTESDEQEAPDDPADTDTQTDDEAGEGASNRSDEESGIVVSASEGPPASATPDVATEAKTDSSDETEKADTPPAPTEDTAAETASVKPAQSPEQIKDNERAVGDTPDATSADKAPEDVESNTPAAAKSSAPADPTDEWAREFLNAQEAGKQEVADALAEIQALQTQSATGATSAGTSPTAGSSPDASFGQRAETAVAETTAAVTQQVAGPTGDAARESEKPTAPKAEIKAELPAFSAEPSADLVIPPVPTAEESERRGGTFKWIVVLLLLALLGGAGYLGLNWDNRAQIASSVGLGGLFADPVAPTPVKTITITPDPEPEPAPEPDPVAEDAPSEPEPPKTEERLVVEDEPADTAVTDQQTNQEQTTDTQTSQADTSAPPEETVADDTQQSSETAAEEAQPDETQAEAQQENELPAADATATPLVAQRAILYEEGNTPANNSFDTGRVVWSVVEEQGGEGEGAVPAIRARVEIASRQVVLIMTIKRNADRALPASHLIELVFAVPDDFSGGAIGEISRFSLKDSEQGRGDALIGVPARISDGIFLIALNNLESAKQTNTQFLRNRSWIDIPMRYRTGRLALMTLEKGPPGGAVFNQVFDAWDELDNRP
ncbi:MAG: hypothetical protein OXR62_04315 [Ahrensia sp.]|nr:hypothetical protein [Ahrensia sp.]